MRLSLRPAAVSSIETTVMRGRAGRGLKTAVPARRSATGCGPVTSAPTTVTAAAMATSALGQLLSCLIEDDAA